MAFYSKKINLNFMQQYLRDAKKEACSIDVNCKSVSSTFPSQLCLMKSSSGVECLLPKVCIFIIK